MVRQILSELRRSDPIVSTLEHQGRGLDHGQQLTDVGQHRLPVVVSDRAGRDRTPPEADELLREPWIVCAAGREARQVIGVAGRPRFGLATNDLEQRLLWSSTWVVGGGAQ
jgi:hypothetical protein